jgi:hypothetical protein
VAEQRNDHGMGLQTMRVCVKDIPAARAHSVRAHTGMLPAVSGSRAAQVIATASQMRNSPASE